MTRRAAWAILATGLAARLALLLTAAAPPRPMEYSLIAARLNAGEGYVFEQYGSDYRAWKEPLYIVLLAGVMRVAGSATWPLIALDSVFGLLTAWLVAGLATWLFEDRRRGALAGLLVAINPFLVYYDARFIHPLSFDSFLYIASLTTILWATRRAGQRPKLAGWRAGLVTGLGLWERTTIGVAGAAAWIVALIRARHRRALAIAAAMWLLTSAFVISPWLIRNRMLLGRWVVTTDAAHIVWLGNNPWSNGTYSDATGQRIIHRADGRFQMSIMMKPELVQADRFRAAASQFIREHPGRFAALCARRLLAFVWFSPNAGVEYSAAVAAAYRAWYVALLIAGTLGLIRWWPRARPDRRDAAALLLAAVAALAVLHSLIAINLKHRVPLELMLSLFAANTLAQINHRPAKILSHGKRPLRSRTSAART